MPEKKAPSKTFIRVFHAFPSADLFDLYLDHQLVGKHLSYEDFSKYLSVVSGPHELILKKNKGSEILLSKRINLRPNSIFTFAIVPTYKDETSPSLFSLEEPSKPLEQESFHIRTCVFNTHFIGSDFLLIEDYPLFKNLKYNTLSSYLPFKIGTYPITLKEHTSANVLLTTKSFPLKPWRFYSAFLIGNGEKNYPHQLVLSIDGRSYLKLEKAQEQA